MSYRSSVNNKRLGALFEREMCEILAQNGYWVHFLAPDARRAQPFDIIAAKGGKAFAIDCKTSAKGSISIGRLEDNQIFAFERWIACGNGDPIVAVKYHGKIYFILYQNLKRCCTVKLVKDLEMRL